LSDITVELGRRELRASFLGGIGGIQGSLLQAIGDLITASAPSVGARLPVGADGTVLVADSDEPLGLRWGAGVPGSVDWGAIGGDLVDQLDLGIALGGKEPSIAAGTAGKYWRYDKTWATLNQAAVAGLTVADSPTLANLVLSAGVLSTPEGSSGDLTLKPDTGKVRLLNLDWMDPVADIGFEAVPSGAQGIYFRFRQNAPGTPYGQLYVNGGDWYIETDVGRTVQLQPLGCGDVSLFASTDAAGTPVNRNLFLSWYKTGWHHCNVLKVRGDITTGELRFEYDHDGNGVYLPGTVWQLPEAATYFDIRDAALTKTIFRVTGAGGITLGGATTDLIGCTGRLLVRQVTDAGPMTATAGTEGEIVYNLSNDKFYVCTATGTPATWATFEFAGAISAHAGLTTGIHGVGASTIASLADLANYLPLAGGTMVGTLTGRNVIPDGADTRDLGGVAAEWANLYLGDAGKVYLGLAQDVNLYRGGADLLKTDDSLEVAGAYLQIPSAAAPAPGAVGRLALDTTDQALVMHDGTAARVYAHPMSQFTFTIPSDASWDSEAVPVFQVPKDMAITIVQVDAAVLGSGTPTLTFNLEERAWASLASAGTDVFSSDQIADADGIQISGATLSNAGIAAEAHLVFTTGASAQGGTVEQITVTVYYRRDVE